MDVQSVLSSIDQLLSLNGWVAALCPTLTRPFGQNKYEDAYDDLAREDPPLLYRHCNSFGKTTFLLINSLLSFKWRNV